MTQDDNSKPRTTEGASIMRALDQIETRLAENAQRLETLSTRVDSLCLAVEELLFSFDENSNSQDTKPHHYPIESTKVANKNDIN